MWFNDVALLEYQKSRELYPVGAAIKGAKKRGKEKGQGKGATADNRGIIANGGWRKSLQNPLRSTSCQQANFSSKDLVATVNAMGYSPAFSWLLAYIFGSWMHIFLYNSKLSPVPTRALWTYPDSCQQMQTCDFVPARDHKQCCKEREEEMPG